MNAYESHPIMIDRGTFWRCDHGCTFAIPCWRCGLKHPIKFLSHLRVKR